MIQYFSAVFFFSSFLLITFRFSFLLCFRIEVSKTEYWSVYCGDIFGLRNFITLLVFILMSSGVNSVLAYTPNISFTLLFCEALKHMCTYFEYSNVVFITSFSEN